jgi:hypothetical protein
MAKQAQADGYNFEETEVPTVEAQPNPFDGIVGQLAEAFLTSGQSKAVSFTIPADTKTSTVTGQLDRAAKELNVTIRRKYADPAEDGTVKATIWATKKRAPKGSLTSGGQPVEQPAA